MGRDPKATNNQGSNAVAGILWMLLSCVLLSCVAALGRLIALEGVPTFQIVFLRLFFAALALSPVLFWRGSELFRTDHIKIYGVRVVIGLVGMTLWFAALAYISVGEVTAIGFLAPIFGTVGAAVLLGETVRWRRWTATLVGFAGALIILRPGVAEFSAGTWFALCAALGMAMASLLIKTLTSRDDPDKVVMISVCLQTPLALVPALFVWEWFDAWLWLAFVGLGVFGMLGHITLTRAFRAADASLIMSIEFARLPFAVALGFMLFGELIDFWTWIGAGVIFLASLYTAQRERLRREHIPAPIPMDR